METLLLIQLPLQRPSSLQIIICTVQCMNDTNTSAETICVYSHNIKIIWLLKIT